MKKKERMAIDQFLTHWGRYIDVQPYQRQWIAKHARYAYYARDACVYDSLWGEQQVFYVCSGMIGRVHSTAIPLDQKEALLKTDSFNEEKTKRSIFSVGLPQMALMSTEHLYSHSQASGEIKALRPSEVLMISYEQIKRFIRDDPSLNEMLYALANKKKRQLARLRQAYTINDPQSRYIQFAETLPELYAVLNQTEQQDLLGISRRTVSRASHLYATGKRTR